eukprot:630141-Pleurochrysis_carterae.AAC.1
MLIDTLLGVSGKLSSPCSRAVRASGGLRLDLDVSSSCSASSASIAPSRCRSTGSTRTMRLRLRDLTTTGYGGSDPSELSVSSSAGTTANAFESAPSRSLAVCDVDADALCNGFPVSSAVVVRPDFVRSRGHSKGSSLAWAITISTNTPAKHSALASKAFTQGGTRVEKCKHAHSPA